MTDAIFTRVLITMNILAVPIVSAIFASIANGTGSLQSLLAL